MGAAMTARTVFMEQDLRSLCDGYHAISVAIDSRVDAKYRFYVYIHDDFGCSVGSGKDLATALDEAQAHANAKANERAQARLDADGRAQARLDE
jgi:hypothetical protein